MNNMMEPKIRFKGFEGEWKAQSLSDHNFSIIAGGDVDKKLLQNNGKYPVIANALTNDGILGYYMDSFRVNGPAVTVTGRGDIGVAIARHYSFTPVVRLLSIKSNHNVDFLANSINCYKAAKESTGVPQLTTAKLQEYRIPIPKEMDEENAIASYFTSLDSQISAATSHLASLKQMKVASLQAMFPQEGETVPKIRFKGFEGEWRTCPLYHFAKKRTEKNTKMLYNITLTNSAEFGIIDQRNFFDHEISNSENINGYYVVRDHDFVYNPRISSSAPVGPINQNKLGYTGVMSPLYLVFEINGINRDFLEIFFHTTLWHKYMFDNGNTGARFDRLAISDEDFMKMPIPDIDIEEQQAIASYFTSLDRQISLQSQRLEKLKQIKSACLDKMFV